MPSKIVDRSARLRHIRQGPWHLHFWAETSKEAYKVLGHPREALASIRIELPDGCGIEPVIENHDWLARHSDGLAGEDGVVACNVGDGNVGRAGYRGSMYAHREVDAGRYNKRFLHGTDEEEAQRARGVINPARPGPRRSRLVRGVPGLESAAKTTRGLVDRRREARA
jgi:hypothetical protein